MSPGDIDEDAREDLPRGARSTAPYVHAGRGWGSVGEVSGKCRGSVVSGKCREMPGKCRGSVGDVSGRVREKAAYLLPCYLPAAATCRRVPLRQAILSRRSRNAAAALAAAAAASALSVHPCRAVTSRAPSRAPSRPHLRRRSCIAQLRPTSRHRHHPDPRPTAATSASTLSLPSPSACRRLSTLPPPR